ncbi:MAG: hypothetical protein IJ714_04180 [Bacteroidales bacterium]|nr:hypothetical protein [Bacteroidales bacterium]
MKKYAFVFAALAVMAAGCAKEDNIAESQDITLEEASSVVFTAGIDTKAHIDGTAVKWDASDAITVWNGTDAAEFTTTDSGATATFTTTATFASAASYVALYPADAGASFSASGVSTTLPEVQTAAAGTFDPAANLAVASTTTTALAFSNLVSYLKFTVPAGMDDLTSVSFKGNAGEKVAGAATVNVGTKALTATGSETATLSGTFTEGETYYLALAPQRFATGYTVTVVRGGSSYDMVSNADVTFARSESRNIGDVWDGNTVAVLSGAAVASPTKMTKVEGEDGKIQFDDVFTYRGALSAGALNINAAYTGTAIQGGITIPADGNYHVMYNETSGRLRVYSQEMYVDFLRSNEHGASVAPWKMLRNIDPDTVDDTAPNYTLVDYDGNLTGARCDLTNFTASNADFKYAGTGGNDRNMPSYYADDEEWTKGALYDGLQILHATGADSDEISLTITGLSASDKYDFRLVGARFNASAAARKTQFVLVGATTSEPQYVFQGWKPANTAAMATYNFMSVHKVDFDGISPDSEGKVVIKVKGVDTGTRADAHLNALRIAKVVYCKN